MTTSEKESRCPYGCEVIVPITLRVSICLQPEVSGMLPVCQKQELEPAVVTGSSERPELVPSIAPGSSVFLSEVVGRRANDETNNMSYLIGRSGSVWSTVLESRVNQETRRITRFVSSKIVSIQQEIRRCWLKLRTLIGNRVSRD